MEDSGVSSTLVGLVGIGIFVVIIGSVLVSTQSLSSSNLDDDVQAAGRDVQSQALAAIILDSTGFAPDGAGTQDWINDPDAMVKFGLLESPGRVSYAKLQNLRLAPYASDAVDGYVNYEEALQAIGDPGLDFHIRAAPSLQSVRDLLASGVKDQNFKVTYIGDIDVTTNGQAPPSDPIAGLSVTDPVCSLSPLTTSNGAVYRFSVDITNGGETNTQFNALWTYTVGDAAATTRTSNTYEVPASGATTTIFLDVAAYDAAAPGVPKACKDGTSMSVDILDTEGTLTSITKTFSTSDEVQGTVATAHDLLLQTDKTNYVDYGASCEASEHIKLEYDSLSTVATTRFALRVVDSTDTEVFPTAMGSSWHSGLKLEKKTSDQVVDIGCLNSGEYTAYMQSYDGSPTWDAPMVSQRILVTAAPLEPFTPSGTSTAPGAKQYFPSDAVVAEVQIIDELVQQFCHTYFDSTTDTAHPSGEAHSTRCGGFKPGAAGQDGDVFPDAKDSMNNDLPARLLDGAGLPRYNEVTTLVVGSNVDHNAMTSAAAKHAVRDWVYGGGNLIVLGSVDQSVNWLQPIFHSGIESSSGGIGTPDPTHPVLRIPDELDWVGYGNPNGNAWDFNAGSDKYFTFVVAQGTGALMAVSNPGAFQEGNVMLTTYIPHDPYGTGTSSVNFQGRVLVNNLLSMGYRDLFLDYGPPLPEKANVAPGVRTVTVEHPDIGPVSVTFTVFVF